MLPLPPKLFRKSYSSDEDFLQDAYRIFLSDFSPSRTAYFDHTEVKCKKHPEIGGQNHTFYHITHEGKDEANRTLSIPRTECIRYPRFFIEHALGSNDLLCWETIRSSKKRILIYHERERYLVVLENRKTFYLLWTAYLVTYEHQHKKLLKEYSNYKNQGMLK